MANQVAILTRPAVIRGGIEQPVSVPSDQRLIKTPATRTGKPVKRLKNP
jgi:hypothetical protein